MDSALLAPKNVLRGVLGVIGLILGLLILLWPGPFAPTDRIPFALVFLIPAIIFLFQVKWDLE